jgi:hypothetical protein
MGKLGYVPSGLPPLETLVVPATLVTLAYRHELAAFIGESLMVFTDS